MNRPDGDAGRIPGIDDGTTATAVSSTPVTRETPFDPATYAELEEIAARYPQARSGLLPMLHLVQSVEGRVSARGIEACAEVLGITAAEVSGVATFYTMYKRRPVGDYHVGVCTNTLCAIMGGDLIFERLKDHLDIGNDETTDNRPGDVSTVTLEHIECNAACDYAPVMTVNWEFMDNMTPETATSLVDDLRSGAEVHSTRGPRVCTWREAERVLAGFPDDLADEGPSAGPASLVGLDIARARGWTAPSVKHSHESEPEPDAAEGSTTSDKSGGSHEAARTDAESEVEASEADAKHEDNPDNTGGLDSARPSGGLDSARPSGGLDSARPSGGLDSARPSGDSARPSGDSARPSGDSARPSGDSARPSGGLDSARPSGDSARPAGDSARPKGDDA